MSAPIGILLLEDDPNDARLIEDLLEADQFVCRIVCVQTYGEFLAALKDGDFDLILSDYKLPSFDGLSALSVALSARPDLPFIFVSGTLGEEAAIEALKVGATDYVLKTRMSRLVPAVRRALGEARDRTARQRAEDALRRRERELRDVIEAIPAIAFTVQPDGSSVWTNRQWIEFSGLSVEETSGLGWQSAIHPDDCIEHVAKWRHSITSGEPFENEARHRSAKGEYRWFLVRAVPLSDELGKILKWYGILTDITEFKRAEERLRVQHTVGQILAEAATIEEVTPRILRALGEGLGWDVGALWRVDRKADALRCVELWHKASIEVSEFERVSRDSAFAPGLGLPGRVWSGLEPEYIPDVVSDENFPRGLIAQREGLHEAFGFPILLGGEVVGVIEFFNREIRQPDQEMLNVLSNVGSQIGQFIERKRAEVELRESEQNYRMLFESIDEGFCTIEVLFDQNEKPVDYRFLQISPSFERQTGIENAAGRRMREIAPQHEEHWFEIYGRIALTGEPIRFENEAKQLGRWYDVYAFRVEDPKRRRVGILFNDITERKRAEVEARESERRYREALTELAHANRVTTMAQLTASIAHEVNQPLGAVVNAGAACLRWLDGSPPNLDEARSAANWMIKEGMRASEVIRSVRALATKASPEKMRLDINDVIREVIELVQRELINDQVSLRTELALTMPMILGDRIQLQQVIINLVKNGIEAMQQVTDHPKELMIRSRQDETQQVLVSVTDCGVGISAKDTDLLFNAFFTTKASGMGMGLSICRSIIEAHGGRLWATANVSHGATFQFTIPWQAA